MFEVLSFVRRSRFLDVERERRGIWINENGSLPHKLLRTFLKLRDSQTANYIVSSFQLQSSLSFILNILFFWTITIYTRSLVNLWIFSGIKQDLF